MSSRSEDLPLTPTDRTAASSDSSRRRRLILEADDASDSSHADRPSPSSPTRRNTAPTSSSNAPMVSALPTIPVSFSSAAPVMATPRRPSTSSPPSPPRTRSQLGRDETPPTQQQHGQTRPESLEDFPTLQHTSVQQASLSAVTPPNYLEFAHHLWLTYSVHELLNSEQGLPEFASYGGNNLHASGMPESEIFEYHTYRHCFPHVPQ